MPLVSFAPPSSCLALRTLLDRLLPSLPPSVKDMDIPPLCREQFILSGYRPVGLSWRCYVLTLFQIHNQTLTVWGLLLTIVYTLMRFLMFSVLQGGGILGFRLQGPEGQGFSVDVSSLPLVLYVLSAVTHLSCSAAAHLLQSHSEEAHFSLFFLDSAGMAVFQYGCALALHVYSSDVNWAQSLLGQAFLPATALLAWFSCTSCCYVKLRFQKLLPLHRRLCQVVPLGLVYLLNISPVTQRLLTHRWRNPATSLHLIQVVLFLLSALFLSCPVPESLSPGRFDLLGHSHQLFHILLSLCMLFQQEALFEDFLWRRPALLRQFGEERLLLACVSPLGLMLCCAATVLSMRRRAKAQLMKEQQ